MRTPILFFTAALLTASCASNSGKFVIFNDIDAVETVSLDEIATDIEVVPIKADYPLESILETFGPSNNFVALDEKPQTVYLVKDYQVVSKLNTVGRGPKEYANITQLAYSAENQTLYAYTPDRKCIYRYEMPDFKYVGSLQVEQDLSAMVLLDSKNLLFVGYCHNSAANSGIYRLNLETGASKRIIASGYIGVTYTSTSSFYKSGDNVFFSLPDGENIIYQYTDTVLTPLMAIDYGQYNFKTDMYPNDGNNFDDMLKYLTYRDEENYAIGCYLLRVTDSAITYWHSPHINGKYHKYFTVCQNGVCCNYNVKVNGLKLKVYPTGLDGDTYVTIINGDWENLIDPDSELSPLAQKVIDTMKKQNDYNPILLKYKLSNCK